MNDPTTTDTRQPRLAGPPTRRRWSVLKTAAGVLAVVIVGLWWVARPRIDSRFVGTWRLAATDKHGEQRATFGSDGRVTGFAHEVAGAPVAMFDFSLEWRTEGDQLIVDADPSQPSTVRQRIDDLIERITGNVAEFRYVILELSPDVIRFYRIDAPKIVTTYRRVRGEAAP